ncbi:MAG: efflux RND transporter periplasmic adaptor subunit [Thermodesulfobacteria bacterium]|nr:efflux RND transporter periplasmic adaptor subunit [Thermodesulfobacteriota bacterium]
MRRILFFFLMVVLLGACSKKEPEVEKPPAREVHAKTMIVSPEKVAVTREFSGQVRARNRVTLSSKVSGYVKRVFVREGDVVSAGTPLLHIDDQPIREQLKALAASLAAIKKEEEAVSARLRYAASNYERFKRLLAEEAATKEEFERVEAEYKALLAREKAIRARAKEIKARMAETESILAYTLIKSPVRALVAKRMADKGSFVGAGQPLILLEDLASGFQFEVSLDESLLPRLRRGQEYWVSFPALDRGEWARVSEVIRKVDPATRTFRVKLDLSSSDLSAGLYGRLYFPVRMREALLIPWKAVVVRGDLTGAMVVEKDGIARFRVLRLGKSFVREKGRFLPAQAPEELAKARETNLYVEVLAGLMPGERIVVSSLEKVRDGDRIK